MLSDIVKQIVAQKREHILLDPQKVKAFFSDLAKDEPERQKRAFTECLAPMHDVVNRLQGVAKEELANRKKSLEQMLYSKSPDGREVELYREALDILCEVLFGYVPIDNVVSEIKDNRTDIES
jgi:hypothetical protein